MAVNNKVYKIPRNVLAQMTNDNPQAIRALENISDTTERTPQDVEDILIKVTIATEAAEQATQIAVQTTATAQQIIADIRPTLNAVSVPTEQSDSLQAVNVSIDCQNQIIPIQVTI